MTKTIALIGALDTKGEEYAFLREQIENLGARTLLIDIGILNPPSLTADVTRTTVAALGGVDADELAARADRGEAMAAMSRGAAVLLPQLYQEGKFDAVLALGGTGGTSVACAAMRALPLGIPKVMVSTVAGTDVSAYVGVSDIVMMPSIVDVSGINTISRDVFCRAASAVVGMARAELSQSAQKPLIVASMFGNTTLAVETAKAILEESGYEVLVFHCTGLGGRTLESLVASGKVAGVLDITTTEWADELVGGVFAAGPNRLEAAARSGVPAVVAPGCLDMVNFWAPDTVPSQFADRTFYAHNPNVTLMRTSVAENVRLGEIIAEKLNLSIGPVCVLFPTQGLSMIDAPGGPFWLPEADHALLAALKSNLRSDIVLSEMDCNINDLAFATQCANRLLDLCAQKEKENL